MNKPLTLTEVSKLVDGMSLEDSMSDERVSDFIGRVEEAGKTILKERGGVEYVKQASEFLLAALVAELLDAGDINQALEILSRAKQFQKIASVIFIYSVGISVTEELR